MAAKRRKNRGGSKGRVPIKVLERRLKRLNTIVKSRGGKAYKG